jgi:hypothetical protein
MAILSSPSRGDYEKIPILDGPDFGLQVTVEQGGQLDRIREQSGLPQP